MAKRTLILILSDRIIYYKDIYLSNRTVYQASNLYLLSASLLRLSSCIPVSGYMWKFYRALEARFGQPSVPQGPWLPADTMYIVRCVLAVLLCSFATSTSIVDSFHEKLVNRDDVLNIAAAYAVLNGTIINSEDAQALVSTPVREDGELSSLEPIPILHYSLKLYFLRRHPMLRRQLVELMTLLTMYGADPNEAYNNEPGVLFKAVLLREMQLANVFVQAGAVSSAIVLQQLYAVPCEPTPIAKLLLNLDTFLFNKGEHTTYEEVKSIIANAHLMGDQKPSVRTVDILAFSKTFEMVVSQLGPAKEGEPERDKSGVTLIDIIDSLSDVASKVHEVLLDNIIYKKGGIIGMLELLCRILDIRNNRNPLHMLAISGSHRMLKDINSRVEMYQLDYTITDTSTLKSVKELLTTALTEKDSRDRTPVEYATLRFGESSLMIAEIKILCSLADLPCDFGKAYTTTKANQSDIIDDGFGDGGWDVEFHPQKISLKEGCDVEEWTGPLPSEDEFRRLFVYASRPVVFRGGAMGSRIRHTFSKEEFINAYGSDNLTASSIPYASSFGYSGKDVSMAEMAEASSPLLTTSTPVRVSGDSIMGDDHIPLYAFTTPSLSWRDKLLQDTPYSHVLESIPANNIETQFYLGPAGSGAPPHFHGHAVNTLAYGEKHCFLYPPFQAFYSKTPSAKFITDFGSDMKRNAALQCTQRAGDMIYVPSMWGHSTFNTQQSIGVAHEFSIENFCME